MSSTDYLLDSIRLLPVLVFSLLLTLFLGFVLRATPTFSHTEDINFRNIPKSILATCLIFSAYALFALYRMFTSNNEIEFILMFLLLLATAWLMMMTWLFTRRFVRILLNPPAFYLLYALFPIIPFVVFLGVRDASSDLRGFEEKYSLEVKGDHPSLVSVFRNLEKGIIYENDEDGKIHFTRWEDVLSFTKEKPELARTPKTCKWLNLWC